MKSLDGPSGTDKDFTDLHAWAEVYLPGAGWIGLDPTSGLLAGEGHLPLACTADPGNAAPVVGFTDPCQVEFSFAMSVTRVHEDPRVTKPYSDTQWADIDALGHRVDADLAKYDVRLTQGGEPTFVSIDDMDGAEWNFAALSPKKRELAEVLLRRLAKRFASGGFLHMGQGKWYPGEPLPRWALGVYWRDDGIPLWRDPALIADTRADGDADIGAAQRCRARNCRRARTRSRVCDDRVRGRAQDSSSPNPRCRRTWIRCRSICRSLRSVRVSRVCCSGVWSDRSGFVLPLKAESPRRPGFRGLVEQPLAAASGTALCARRRFAVGIAPAAIDRSPMCFRRTKTSRRRSIPSRRAAICRNPNNARRRQPGRKCIAAPSLRAKSSRQRFASRCATAMSLSSCRRLKRLEDYVALLASVERAAARVGRAVAIEGYTPPRDPRITVLNVTPDPGVIEVNVHPASTWDEFVTTTEILYEEARQSRLGTEKFMFDGRHMGTGGGNHVTLGGATPADSPLLRRPDLLRSLITYWQNHPCW